MRRPTSASGATAVATSSLATYTSLVRVFSSKSAVKHYNKTLLGRAGRALVQAREASAALLEAGRRSGQAAPQRVRRLTWLTGRSGGMRRLSGGPGLAGMRSAGSTGPCRRGAAHARLRSRVRFWPRGKRGARCLCSRGCNRVRPTSGGLSGLERGPGLSNRRASRPGSACGTCGAPRATLLGGACSDWLLRCLTRL